jgi:hypothetical protein
MSQEGSVEIHNTEFHIDISRSQIIICRRTYRYGEATTKKFCNFFLSVSRITERPSERIFT